MIQPLTAAVVCDLVAAAPGSLAAAAALDPALASDPLWKDARRMRLTARPDTFRALDRDRSLAAWSLRRNPVPPSDPNRTNAATVTVDALLDDRAVEVLAIVSGTASAAVLLALLPADTVLPEPLPAD